MSFKFKFYSIIAILLFLSGGALYWYHYGTITTINATITQADRSGQAAYGNGTMRVYTSNGVFENYDAPLNLKWNSGDHQADALANLNKTCDITVNKVRFALFSKFQNVLKIENCK